MALTTLRKLYHAVTQRIHRQQLYKWMDLVSTSLDEDSPFVVVRPLGGGVDDWPRLNALMALYADKKAIVLLNGDYVCKTRGVVPSGTTLLGGSGVTITQTLPTSPYSPLDATFSAANVSGASTTCAANRAAGATTISVVADVAAAGQYIVISPSHLGPNAGLRSRLYLVEDVSGAGPFIYTLDRPLGNNLVTGDSVTETTPPKNITIDGRGMVMQGVGQRFIEIACGASCTIKNINGFASGGDIAFSFDVASLDCTMENIYADGGGAMAAACLALESAERSKIVNCVARNSGPGVFGIALYDCSDCDVIDSYGTMNGNAGLTFVSDGNPPLACESCTVQGGDYSGNTVHGVWSQNGSRDILCEEVTANWNGGNGFQQGDGTHATTEFYLSDCVARGNAYGVGTQAPASLGFAENCDFSDNAGAMASLESEFNFDTCAASLPITVTNILVFGLAASYDVRLTDCKINSPRIGGINNLQPPTGVRIHLDGCELAFGSTGLVPEAGSVIRVQRTRISQVTPGVSAMIVNGGTLRIGPDVDADNCTAPLTIASGFCNRAQVTANGTTPVNVAWPDLKSTERVQLTLATKGGTPSAMPAITYTAGTQFTLTSYAADSSVYDYVIE